MSQWKFKQKCSYLNQLVSLKNAVRSGALGIALSLAPASAQADGLRAGEVIEIMDKGEVNAYTAGLVEGLAYARFVKDGKQSQDGMRCILDWYYEGENTASMLYLAFGKFKDHFANAVVATLANRQCGG